jgi:cystathionine beta-synthase
MPSTINFNYVDDVVRVNDKECFVLTRRMVREEGIFPGTSSGAAVAGAIKWLKLHGTEEMVSCVLLPDSGSRYLSKVFNDAWMRENGFLEPETWFGTVRDLLEKKGQGKELVTVSSDARVSEVVGLLKIHGVSQVPVTEEGKVIGIVTENRLLERALAGTRPDNTIRDLVEASYCTVDLTTEVAVLTELFKRAKVAIVTQGAKPIDIITRIDLIDHIANVTSNARSAT